MNSLLEIIGMCLLIVVLVAMCAPERIGEAGRSIHCGFYATCPEVKP